MPQKGKHRESGEGWQQRLMGVAELALAFGVKKSTITRWANEGLLPEPLDTLKLGRVWSVVEIVKLFDLIDPNEDVPRDSDRGRIYGERLRLLKSVRDKKAQKGSSSTGTRSSRSTR